MIRPSRPFNFNSHSRTGSDKSIHTKIKLSATQLVSVFLPYKRILAHKRAFFNMNFMILPTKQNQSCKQDCKKCVYAALTGVIL